MPRALCWRNAVHQGFRDCRSYLLLLCVSQQLAHCLTYGECVGFPGGSDGKESTCNMGDLGSVPGLGRSPGRGHGNPPPYPCLENPMDRGAWQAAVQMVTQSRTRLKWLSSSSNNTQNTSYSIENCTSRVQHWFRAVCLISPDPSRNKSGITPGFFLIILNTYFGSSLPS